jgi:hypothetical protein
MTPLRIRETTLISRLVGQNEPNHSMFLLAPFNSVKMRSPNQVDIGSKFNGGEEPDFRDCAYVGAKNLPCLALPLEGVGIQLMRQLNALNSAQRTGESNKKLVATYAKSEKMRPEYLYAYCLSLLTPSKREQLFQTNNISNQHKLQR